MLNLNIRQSTEGVNDFLQALPFLESSLSGRQPFHAEFAQNSEAKAWPEVEPLERAGLSIDLIVGEMVVPAKGYGFPGVRRKASTDRDGSAPGPWRLRALSVVGTQCGPGRTDREREPGPGAGQQHHAGAPAIPENVFPRGRGAAALVAGLKQFGTGAGGELLSNPLRFGAVLRSLENARWRNANLQLVLEAGVIGNTPTAPKLVAWHVW